MKQTSKLEMKQEIDKRIERNDSLKGIFPVLPEGEYHDLELYSAFHRSGPVALDGGFETEFQVFLVKDQKIVGTAKYIYKDHEELISSQINNPKHNHILFDQGTKKMSDYFNGTAVVKIGCQLSGGCKENYIDNFLTLKQEYDFCCDGGY